MQCIDLKMPCPDVLWDADNEAEWQQQLNLLNVAERSEPDFHSTVYPFITYDLTNTHNYELASSFGQQILLAAALDTINAASKIPTYHKSALGWRNNDMSTFTLRDNIQEILDLWTCLWWTSPECLWDLRLYSRLETIIFKHYITATLNSRGPRIDQGPPCLRGGVRASTDLLCGISKTGFATVGLALLNAMIHRTKP